MDIGTSSIGWALVHEEENSEQSRIKSAGVRIIPMGDEEQQYIEGKQVTLNADRREYRSIRRNNQRYKLRRHRLINALLGLSMMPDEDCMKRITAEELYGLRDRALRDKLALTEIGRIFLHLNQRRGYKSNRKADKESETDFTQTIIDRSNELKIDNLTVGQHFYRMILANRENPSPNFKIREKAFLRSDYLNEFNAIWDFQQAFYPDILTNENRILIRDRIIYYQRRLKSQKGLVSECRYEKHHKAAPKSSPLFQLFNTLSKVNNLQVYTRDGEVLPIDDLARENLIAYLDNNEHITATQLFQLWNLRPTRNYICNFEKIEGNITKVKFRKKLMNSGVPDDRIEALLKFTYNAERPDFEPLYKLWHLVYSAEDDHHLISKLVEGFGLTEEQSAQISKIGYASQYGALSSRAIRKLLPHLYAGKKYHEACEAVGYNHTDTETVEERASRVLSDAMAPVKRNEFRNPVVEKICSQVVTLVNTFISSKGYGRPDEIRVELARQLKQNARERQDATESIRENEKENDRIVKLLMSEWGFRKVSRKDIIKYKLWLETGCISVYTGKPIQKADLFNTARIDVEHIIPRALLFDDSFGNKTLCERELNIEKSKKTAFDFMSGKGDTQLEEFKVRVRQLFNEHKISKGKFTKLMMKSTEIPEDFIDRQLRESQYIAREITTRLNSVCRVVVSTTGSVTDYLRHEWGLNTILEELNLEKYRKMGKTYIDKDHTGNSVERISDWTKREDHRHHAIDAIVIACTRQGMIQKLNRLHAMVGGHQDEFKETISELQGWRIREPFASIRAQSKEAIERVLISFKNNRKVVSRQVNRIKTKHGEKRQITLTPRGFLHKETVYGRIFRYRKVPVDKRFTPELYALLALPHERFVIENHLRKYDQDFKVAFAAKTLLRDPLLEDKDGQHPLNAVTVFDPKFVYRVKLDGKFNKIEDVVDGGIRILLEKRLEAFANDPKKAFSDLDNNPVWHNEEKKIPVRTVRVFGPVTLQPIHLKKDGEPVDYVHTRNNHHVAIYEAPDGKRYEKVVPFWEAVERVKQGIPAIDRNPQEGHKFILSMQINDMFVFGLNPDEVDFANPKNWPLISEHLYRVQKLASGDYTFRHHLETTLKNDKTQIRISAITKMNGIKVWVDRLGNLTVTGVV